MKNIAIIPARGGSKRIYKKNIRYFFGKPIIQYSIETAIQSGLFDEVMVSTDDEEIASIAIAAGAKVPFLRTAETANDFATITDVVAEVLQQYQSVRGEVFDNVCCIFATAPFVTSQRIKEAHELLIAQRYASVFPVARFSYPIMRALKIDDQTNYVSMIWPEYLNSRSQDIPDAYHDCGQFYWADIQKFNKFNTFFTPETGTLELGALEYQDIDSEEDWQLAEVKFRMFQTR
ncbi:pseudaminic acid cytidylyltransferase [Chitinophaga arvensicola]|uniref:N-acylneuraminate cytidylyltransferase n=1 Tax=Chitinophaga arvensicola TaxID=29529 RepID=A0A1I0NQ06_9BACT|nr:pseudaminic acid cytidylyltransferase [Chitinophaga arvensicola]SEW03520.1 N-acylneuraminate cytidylyltransferase [Chitinophaga arvensicola]